MLGIYWKEKGWVVFPDLGITEEMDFQADLQDKKKNVIQNIKGDS